MRKTLSTTTGPQRLVYGAVFGVAVALVPWPLVDGMARVVLGWTAGAGLYLVLAWWLAHTFDARQTRERAQSMDQPNVVLLIVMLSAVLFSVVAIAMLLRQVKDLDGADRALHVVLSLVALAVSWLLIHTVYATHYAHSYYLMQKAQKGQTGQKEANGPKEQEPAPHGLDFPGSAAPDYADFIYFSYVIGMTSQVSDVQVLSPELRRVTLVHSVLSFAFNMLVLALSINVVAGVIS